jgi:hypothetical protein
MVMKVNAEEIEEIGNVPPSSPQATIEKIKNIVGDYDFLFYDHNNGINGSFLWTRLKKIADNSMFLNIYT